jgi:hypothetical protein
MGCTTLKNNDNKLTTSIIVLIEIMRDAQWRSQGLSEREKKQKKK